MSNAVNDGTAVVAFFGRPSTGDLSGHTIERINASSALSFGMIYFLQVCIILIAWCIRVMSGVYCMNSMVCHVKGKNERNWPSTETGTKTVDFEKHVSKPN